MRVHVRFNESDERIPVGFRGTETRTTGNYEDLSNKPRINGVTLVGDLSDEDLHIKGGNFWFGTRAEYNALPSIDPDVCYCIEEGT